MHDPRQTRRGFILAAGSIAAGLDWGAIASAAAQELAPTPACVPGGAVTPRQGEGPFYKPRSPRRSDLREPASKGRSLELAGTVLSRRCRPLADAVVDLWHADENGDYDNEGFKYRGHVLTGGDGTYRFRTIVPAAYSGRARHYHVKVQAPGSRPLTTQLYFPNEPQNRRDGMFRRDLLMRVADASDGLAARLDLVL
jgi:protocatechuate 3,4-dioxygenase beta subunit